MARSKSSLMAGVGTYHFRPLPLPSVVNIECPAVAANPIQVRRTGVSESGSTEDAQLTHRMQVILVVMLF